MIEIAKAAYGPDSTSSREGVSGITAHPRNHKYLVPARADYSRKLVGRHVISMDPRWPSVASDRDYATIWIPMTFEKREVNAEVWDEHAGEREPLAGAHPGAFHIARGRLHAHVRSDRDVDKAVAFIRVFARFDSSASPMTDAEVRSQLSQRAASSPSVDITDLLPAILRDVLFELHRAQRVIRDDRAYKAAELDAREYTESEAKRAIASAGLGTDRVNIGHFALSCHEFVLMVLAGEPNAESGTLANTAELTTQRLAEGTSSASRLVPQRSVEVGDVALFRVNRHHYWGTERNLQKGEVVHAGFVIRVDARTPQGIELLEKRDPEDFASTRTVAEVLDHYKLEGVEVVYVRPNHDFAESRRRERAQELAAP